MTFHQAYPLHPNELEIKKNDSETPPSCWPVLLYFDCGGHLSASLYDSHDDFNFNIT